MEDAARQLELSKDVPSDLVQPPVLEQPAPAEPAPVREKSKENAFVAVANGEGICAVLRDLGVDELVTGGQTMNPSTQDILEAVPGATPPMDSGPP